MIDHLEPAEDAFRREREAYERNARDYNTEINNLCEERRRLLNQTATMAAAIRCAYQNLEQSANSPIPSLLAVRAALQALRPYMGLTIPNAKHGSECPKTPHDAGVAYEHAADMDGPYFVDGVRYCGRCHYYF